MKIIYTTDDDILVQGTPAAVSQDGTLYINTDLFEQLTPFQQEFVKWHEIGHYRLQTHDEIEADTYAFHKMAGKYHQSLKKMIGTLQTVLDPLTDPNVQQRIESLYRLCLKYDANLGNKAAAEELRKIAKAENNANTTNTAKHKITVWRNDGRNDRSVAAAEATGNAMNDLVSNLTVYNYANKKAESEAETNDKTLTFLMIGFLVVFLLKDD